MKLHCAIPLLVSFKSVLQRPTPSLGDPEPVYTRRNLLGSVCYGGGGGTVQDLWGKQMHLPDSAGFRHLSSLSHHTPPSQEHLKQFRPWGVHPWVCYSRTHITGL